MKMNSTKLHDAVFGLAIGDALGVPYEFEARGTFQCTGMTGYGTHNQPEGTWSDDTSMVLATLDSLKSNNGKILPSDMFEKFNHWLLYGDYTAHGEVFDAGIATCNALRTGKPQSDEYDNGNGSLMRILPLAFVPCTDDEIRAVSAITHGHRISMDACVIYVHVARSLLAGMSIDEIIPTLQYDKPFDRLHRINQLSAREIKSTGYVVDTLEAALWALSHKSDAADQSRNFRTTLLEAVNLGSDTDTIGAVTGGLAGIIYGLDEVTDWVKTLQNREELERYLW